MTTKVDKEPTLLDTAKLAVAVAIVVGAVVGFYAYPEQSQLLRTIGVLVAVGIAIWVALQSAQGQSFWRFFQECRVELRKVVWPTREETIQTTVAVLVFSIIMGVFFWLLDLFLLFVTSSLTGQGG